MTSTPNDDKQRRPCLQQQQKMLRNRTTTPSLAVAGGPQLADPRNTGTNQVTRGELDRFLLTEPLIARRAQAAARRARLVLGEIDLCPPVDRRTHQTKAFRYFKQAISEIRMSECPSHDERKAREQDLAAYRRGCTSGSHRDCTIPMFYLLASENLDNFLELMQSLDTPARKSDGSNPSALTSRAEATGDMISAAEISMSVDGTLGCDGGKADKSSTMAPSEQCAQRTGAEMNFSVVLDGSRLARPVYWQPGRAHVDSTRGNTGDRPCSRASSDPARWSRGLPVDKTFPPRPQAELSPASWGKATGGTTDRPSASSVDPLDDQRLDDDAIGTTSCRRTTGSCANVAAGFTADIYDENVAVSPTRSSPSGFSGGDLAPRPDQGASVAIPFLHLGSKGDEGLLPQGWVGAGEGESWLRMPPSTSKTADYAAIITSPLDRMDMSNTLDSEAAVAGGAFYDRNLSFDSSIGHASDTDMVCFERSTGDRRRNFGLYPGYSENEEEEEGDEGSEESFPHPDPSDPADGGLPCLSRGLHVGSAATAVS